MTVRQRTSLIAALSGALLVLAVAGDVRAQAGGAVSDILDRLEAEIAEGEGRVREEAPEGGAQTELAKAIADGEARAGQGDPRAQFLLGVYLRNSADALGDGRVDLDRVVSLYRNSSEKGYAPADHALGNLYLHGIGMPEDVHKAIAHLRRAAAAGMIPAMASLGAAYATVGEISQSVVWSRKAADAGNPSAMNTLGALHQKGFGVEKDYRRSMDLYQRAAAAGDCNAVMNIGGLHYNGDGVTQDAAEAERWFTRAKTCQSEDSAANGAIADRYLARIRQGRLPQPENAEELASRAADDADVAVVAAILFLAAMGAGSGGSPGSDAGCNMTFNMDAGTCDAAIDTMIAGAVSGIW